MRTDAHGLQLSVASATAAAQYDLSVDHLVHFRSEVTDACATALAEEPGFAMARALSGYLGLLGTEASDAAAVRAEFGAGPFDGAGPGNSAGPGSNVSMNPRERAHLRAVAAWANGDLSGAGAILAQISWEYPRDLLALAVGHQIDFFRADARSLRDRIGGALTSWSPADQHWGPVLGLYAFGLEEAGHYDRSEDVALAAVAADAKDVWGIHAVVHTYEMKARSDQGLRFLAARSGDWAVGNFLNVHNWWHLCLYLLEAGESERALAVYDSVLHHDASAHLAMEMLDAAALLWRLFLEGEDQSARWTRLADAWRPKVEIAHYAFNDAHAVMSFVGAGRFGEAERLIAARAQWTAENAGATTTTTTTNIRMTADIGLPVMRAFVAFGRGRYADTIAFLAPIRHRINEFGGSHAQRDAVQRTLLEAALRAGDTHLVRTLLSERIGVRPGSPYNWLKQSVYAEQIGALALAADARARAAELTERARVRVPRPLPAPVLR